MAGSATSSTEIDSLSRTIRRRRLARAGAVVAASVVAAVVWVVGEVFAGVSLVVGSGPTTQTVGPASIMLVPLVAGAAAWALLAILENTVRRGRLIWTIVGWTVLVLSLLGPVTMAHSPGAVATLIAMHVGVGVTLILGLPRFPAPRTRVH